VTEAGVPSTHLVTVQACADVPRESTSHRSTPETLEDGSETGEGGVVALAAHFYVVFDADHPFSGGSRHGLRGVDEVFVGRDPSPAGVRFRRNGRRLTVGLPSPWMSSTHFRLYRDGLHWTLEDTGSRNGTFVDGARVSRSRVSDGVFFDAGHTLFAVRLAQPAPPELPEDHCARGAPGATPANATLSPVLVARFSELGQVAQTSVPVLVLGETGSGKEVVAREVHRLSRRPGPFVAVNCAGLAPTLVEGLLFGHTRGAFSGAARDEPGFIRAADQGTLFLDEVGDLSHSAQSVLLRVLQEREVTPLGSARTVPVDFRLVCATHRPLDELVAEGRFRADLLARMDGFRHCLPPLRERREDLGVLIAGILPRIRAASQQPATFTVEAARALATHGWAGNVRELVQALSRASALATDGRITESRLSLLRARDPTSESAGAPTLSEDDARLRDRLVEELRRHRGNVSEVARSMGKARMQVQRWMSRLRLDAHQFRSGR
jgi:transcriptional regulator with AAA-type ATPase domain